MRKHLPGLPTTLWFFNLKLEYGNAVVFSITVIYNKVQWTDKQS